MQALYIGMTDHKRCHFERQVPAIIGLTDAVIAERIRCELKSGAFGEKIKILKRKKPEPPSLEQVEIPTKRIKAAEDQTRIEPRRRPQTAEGSPAPIHINDEEAIQNVEADAPIYVRILNFCS